MTLSKPPTSRTRVHPKAEVSRDVPEERDTVGPNTRKVQIPTHQANSACDTTGIEMPLRWNEHRSRGSDARARKLRNGRTQLQFIRRLLPPRWCRTNAQVLLGHLPQPPNDRQHLNPRIQTLCLIFSHSHRPHGLFRPLACYPATLGRAKGTP